MENKDIELEDYVPEEEKMETPEVCCKYFYFNYFCQQKKWEDEEGPEKAEEKEDVCSMMWNYV